TTFRLYLPRVDEIAETMASSDVPAVPRGFETVLLVEDEDAVRTLSRRVLESHGYTVLEASDGLNAIGVARRHEGPIHILVADLVMPRLGGRQLAIELTSTMPHLKVLLMSGYSDVTLLPQGVVESSVPFLHKPFSPMALVRKVREVLDQA